MMKKTIEVFVKWVFPNHMLISKEEHSDDLGRLIKALKDCEEYAAKYKTIEARASEMARLSFDNRRQIRVLEEVVGRCYNLPMNFKQARKDFDLLTPKAKSAYLHTLISGIDEASLIVMEEYIKLRKKEDL